MSEKLVEYQFLLMNADNSAVDLEVTSVRGGTNPYISEDGVPTGDGASFDPITGVVTSGSFSLRIVDPITSGTSRLFTSILEDANGRQQLGHRRAFIEFREDGGAWQTLYAGRLTRYALANDVVWEIAVSDFMEAEHKHQAFAQKRDTTQTDGYEPFATYLARWPNRGSLLCGIRGGFLHIPDRKGWQFKITGHGGGISDDLDYRWTRFEYVSGYDPIGNVVPRNSDRLIQIRDEINAAAEPFWEPNYADSPFGGFPELRAIVDGTAYRFAQHVLDPSVGESPRTLLTIGGDSALSISRCAFYLQGHVGTLNSVVRVEIISRAPSEASPIYWTGHPADLVAKLSDEAGLPYSASALSALKDAIGRGARISLRVSAPQNMGTFLEQAVYGLWGVGARCNSLGEIEHFNGRIMVSNALPAVTITSADVAEGSTRAFDLDATKAIRTVNAEQTRLVQPLLKRPVGPEYVDPAATEALVTQAERVERTNDDPGAIGTGEVTYTIPGMVHYAQIAPARERLEFREWVDGRAAEIFDRTGRGRIGCKATILRTSPAMSAKLGDEVLVNLPQLPNKNKRLVDDATVGARAMQIVHLTPTLIGHEVTLEDSGPNAQPFATIPTITVAKQAGAPRSIATITITNAATLNAAGAACRVQIAFTSGAAPLAADYTDVLYFRAGQILTTAQILPPAAAASTVYVRARAEHRTWRPSNWSAVASVALDPLNAPTSLVATPSGSDGSKADLTWVVGANAGNALVEVWLRLQAEAFAAAVLKDLLPGGSTFYRIEELTPGVNYTASVRHLDESTGDYSTLAEVSFTAGATTVTLAPPTNPDGFSIPQGATDRAFNRRVPSRGPRYGLVVVAREFPSEVAVEEALETGVGTNVYGAYSEVGRVASIAGDWTMWSQYARSDKLKRKLRARHVRGAAASTYTAEVIVDPTVYDAVAAYPVSPPTASVTPVLASRTATSETLQFNGALGANADGPLSWRYQEDDGAWSSPSTVALPQNVAFTRGKTNTKLVKLEVTQGDGQKAYAEGVVPPELPALRPIDGVIKRTVPYDDGDYAVSSSANDGRTILDTVNESGGKRINRLLPKPLPSSPDTIDSVLDGATYGRPLNTALTAGQVDFSKNGVINRTTNHVTTRNATPGGTWTSVGNFTYDTGHSAATVTDSEIAGNHFRVDTAVGGHYLQVDFGAAVAFDAAAMFAATAGFNSAVGFSVRHSSDGSSWTTVATLTPTEKGWNIVTFARTSARYWRLELNGTPGAGPWFTQVELSDSLAVELSSHRARDASHVAERAISTLQRGNPGHFRDVAKESGGKTINRLLPKPLSSSPDDFDSVVDGTSFKKVTGVNGSNQVTPSSSVGRSRCQLRNTGNIALSGLTLLTWDTEDYDVGGLHSTSSNTSRITVPSGGNTGLWVIVALLSFSASATGVRNAYVRKNGSTVLAKVSLANNGSVSDETQIQIVAHDDNPSVGDYYEILAEAGAAVSVTTNSRANAVHNW